MKKFKKWMVLGLALALLAGIAGCGKAAETGGEKELGKEAAAGETAEPDKAAENGDAGSDGNNIYRTLDEIKKDGTCRGRRQP